MVEEFMDRSEAFVQLAVHLSSTESLWDRLAIHTWLRAWQIRWMLTLRCSRWVSASWAVGSRRYAWR